MSEDINSVFLMGRLVRDSELKYTNSGYPFSKMSIAVNRRKKEGDSWIDESHFFDLSMWGKRAESLNKYLAKGQQIAIEGQLRQERWDQDGQKRSRVSIDVSNIQLVGGKKESSDGKNAVGNFNSYVPNSANNDTFEDDTPF